MLRSALLTALVMLVAAAPAEAKPWLLMKDARQAVHREERLEVRRGYSEGFQVKGCQRLKRVRVRCYVVSWYDDRALTISGWDTAVLRRGRVKVVF